MRVVLGALGCLLICFDSVVAQTGKVVYHHKLFIIIMYHLTPF